MIFERAVDIILAHEGGYVFNSKDPGGETKFGISKRQYPHLDIARLTREDAIEIYREDYWDKVSADSLPSHIRLMVFDCAVNQGIYRAAKILQRAAGAATDGNIGWQTIAAVVKAEPLQIIRSVAILRHEAYSTNPYWQDFGKGWSKRLLDITLRSVAQIESASDPMN